jgi:RNA polymerase sigma-70 factor (ECF subfamily)
MNAITSDPSSLPAPPVHTEFGEPDALPAEADGFDGLFEASGDEAAEARVDERPSAGCAANAGDEALAEWIERIAERDERALCALYDATLARVYGLVLRIVRRPAWAEEAVEDTYFQVWRQAVRFDRRRGRALTWLLGMARSRAIDVMRREARFAHDTLDADDAPCLSDTTARPADELLDAAKGHAVLHGALLTLSAQPRQLVALAFFSGLSHEEIAAQTALPLGTVKSQIRRALISLREIVGELGLRAPAA